MIRYLNIKTKYGVETWETIHRKDFKTYVDFIQEIKNLKHNYDLMGYKLYTSQRASNN